MFIKLENYLAKKRKLFTKNNNAFTLIELIIVIVIIGTLVAIAAPNFGKNAEDAKVARAKSDVKTLAGAAQIYYAETGLIPDTSSFCTALQKTDSSTGVEKGPWLKNCPVAPWTESKYTLDVSSPKNIIAQITPPTSTGLKTITSNNLDGTTE